MLNRSLLTLTILTLVSISCTKFKDKPEPIAISATKAPIQVTKNLKLQMNHLADSADFAKKQVRELSQENIYEMRDEMVTYLEDRIFTKDQIESSSETAVVYKIKPENLCQDDIDCIDVLTEHPVRIRLNSFKEGNIDAVIVMGNDKIEPITVSFHKNELAVNVDMAKVSELYKYYAESTGNKDVSFTADGELRLSLTQTGQAAATATLQVVTDISAKLSNAKAEAMALDVKRGTVIVEANAQTKQVYGDIQLGQFLVSMPYVMAVEALTKDPVANNNNAADVLALTVAGLTGSASFDINFNTVKVTGFGFGNNTARLARNGNTILAVDLNPNNDGAFDVTVARTDKERIQVDVSPIVDLSVEMYLGKIAEIIPEQMGMLMQPDVLSLLFDSADTPSLAVIEGGFKVLAGQLSLMSKMNPESNMTIEKGQCLAQVQHNPNPDAHPFFEGFHPMDCN